MPKKRNKPASSRKSRRQSPKRPPVTHRDEEANFVRSLVEHGQAVAVKPCGKLPPGATHELVKEEDGTVKVVRRRFTAF